MTSAHKKSMLTSHEVMSILPTFPVSIANELRPLLANADIATYRHFLSTMYHYTRNAEEQLTHARDMCADPILHKYFDIMAKEERGHYLLAKKDYEEFGDDVTITMPPSSVKKFQAYWYGLGQDNVNEFVGAMYVFENVAAALAREIIDMMQRLELTKKQTRWLRVHLEADVGHGDEAMQMCAKYVMDNPSAMLRAAEYGSEEWASVFKHAFSNKS